MDSEMDFFKSFITRFPPKNLYELWGLANGVTKKQRETYEEGDKKNHGNGERMMNKIHH
jgi:hypothetical protein